jgi:hypothetical protein
LEDYAGTSRIAPSAALEAAIEELLAEGLGDSERLAEIGRLGARLVLQQAVEEEVTAFLGRGRYERTAEARGSRNGNRPRHCRPPRESWRSRCRRFARSMALTRIV